MISARPASIASSNASLALAPRSRSQLTTVVRRFSTAISSGVRPRYLFSIEPPSSNQAWSVARSSSSMARTQTGDLFFDLLSRAKNRLKLFATR